MNQLSLVKNLFEPKAISNGNCNVSDKWLKQADSNDKANDFGKILKQREPQEKQSKRSENFSQSDKKSETQEDVPENQDEGLNKSQLPEIPKDETDVDDVCTFFNGSIEKIEDDNLITKPEELTEPQISEDFSTDEVQVVKNVPIKDTIKTPEQDFVVPVIVPVLEPVQPVADVTDEGGVSDDFSEPIIDKIDLPVVQSEHNNRADSVKVAVEETSPTSEVRTEDTKTNLKVPNPISVVPKNSLKTMIVAPKLNVQTLDSPQNVGNLSNLQYFETWNNVGIKSAPKDGDRKGGFVSSGSTVLTEFEGPLHRDSTISSNGSRVAEVLSQKTDMPSPNDLEQHFEGKESVLPVVQPKVAVNTYETVRQEHAETVQGIIATLEQQMDELKRTRRNSVIVRVDLENGETLNCQVTLSRSDVAIRFPALEESFKMQILNHWESLRKFAQTRQFNLSEPHFIAQTSL